MKAENKWIKNQLAVIFKRSGWYWFILSFFCLSSLVIFFSDLLEIIPITPYSGLIDYVIRFMIFEIPASITIFSFIYKEQKEASYSNTKISNIPQVFRWTITLAISALILSILTVTLSDSGKKGIIVNKTQFLISVSYGIISFCLLVFFIRLLLSHMDIKYSFNKTWKRTNKYHILLSNLYLQKSKKLLFNYSHIMNGYAHLIEANFQLLMASMAKNNLSALQKELKKVFIVSNDFYQHFINVKSLEDLALFLSKDNESFLFSKTKEPFNNKENLIEIYYNILLNYKLLIRECSKLGMARIQKQAYTEFTSLNPIKMYNFELERLSEDDFINVRAYYEELIDHYHTSLYEILNEFSDEDTVEYSYLLEKVASTSEYFSDITVITDEQGQDRQRNLYATFINKNLTLLEAIIISATESNNIRFLTESTNILLRYYYTQVPFPTSQAEKIKTMIRGEDGRQVDFLGQFIQSDLKNISEAPQAPHYYKEMILKRIIEIIVLALHKSIEIGHYQCTGYLTKISCSHIIMKDFLNSISEYTNKIIDRQIISYDLNYYHYSINNFSKIHCLQKLLIILGFQSVYKFGDSTVELLSATVNKIFASNHQEVRYMIDKVLAAEKSYGMLAISEFQKEELLSKLGIEAEEIQVKAP
ncbi:hypothetical protein ABE033_13770 [Priestia megaterium]